MCINTLEGNGRKYIPVVTNCLDQSKTFGQPNLYNNYTFLLRISVSVWLVRFFFVWMFKVPAN